MSQIKLMNIKHNILNIAAFLSIALYANILTTTWRVARHHYVAFLLCNTAEFYRNIFDVK